MSRQAVAVDHVTADELLWYVARDLPGHEHERVVTHLRHCWSCAWDADEVQRIFERPIVGAPA